MSLRIGGGEVYLEEKGYSGIDGRADAAPAAAAQAAGSWDGVPPEEREGAWTALLPPRERERLLGRPPRVHGQGSLSHIWWPLSDSDCVICPLEEVSSHRRPGDERGQSPGRTSGRSSSERDCRWQRDKDYRWRRGTLGEDTAQRAGIATWRWESRGWRRENCSRRREWPDDLQERGPDRSQERLPDALARAACD